MLRHIEKIQCDFATDCFLSGFVVSIHRTLHRIISIDMKSFVQETRSTVFSSLLPAFCTGDNGNKVKVANHSSSRLVNTSCCVTRTLFPTRKSYTRYIGLRHHQNAASVALTLDHH